jgi:hypothetical protein
MAEENSDIASTHVLVESIGPVISLADLHVDIWRELNHLIEARSIARLYLVGNRNLQQILTVRGGIVEFHYYTTPFTRSTGWFSRISEFRGLKSYIFDVSLGLATKHISVTKTELQQLPSTLERLNLSCNGAENAFWADEAPTSSDDGSRQDASLDIGLQWPNLKYLILEQYFSVYTRYRYIGRALASLPPTLTMLRINSIVGGNGELGMLPRGLKSYENRWGRIDTSELVQLPPSLEELIFSTLVDTNLADKVSFAALPHSLTALTLIRCRHFELRMIRELPPNLTYLDLDATITAEFFPEIRAHLQKLQYLSFGLPSKDDWKSDLTEISYIQYFSPSDDIWWYSWGPKGSYRAKPGGGRTGMRFFS